MSLRRFDQSFNAELEASNFLEQYTHTPTEGGDDLEGFICRWVMTCPSRGHWTVLNVAELIKEVNRILSVF